MKYQAEQLFSSWHSKITIDTPESILQSRKKAIENIINDEDLEKDFWIDILKLSQGITLSNLENQDKLISAFRATETSFPLENNEFIIQFLSCSLVCFKLEGENSDLNNLISIGFYNLNFIKKETNNTGVNITPFADYYLNNSISNNQAINLVDLKSNVQDVRDNIDSDEDDTSFYGNLSTTLDIIDEALNINKVLLEETNILWWIFGEYCDSLEKYFKDSDKNEIIIGVSLDLANKVTFNFPNFSARHILKKALLIANSYKDLKETTLFDIQKSSSKKIKETAAKLLDGKNVTDFVPCLTALKKSLEFESSEDWSSSYKIITNGGELKKKYSQEELAFQLFKEVLFLKNLN